MYPGPVRAAIQPQATRLDQVTWAVQARVRRASGWVPPFRAASRDRWASGLAASWRPADPVALDLDWSWLWDSTPAGGAISGPGDLRLGVRTEHQLGSLELAGGWQVKLPNAQDQGELGSDETDVRFLGTAGHRWARMALRLSGGLEIRGDPIRFASQDDVPLAWLSGVGQVGPVDLSGRVGGDLATARSPARLEAGLGVAWGSQLHLGTELTVGLTPAAADWGAGAWVGWGAVPSPRRD